MPHSRLLALLLRRIPMAPAESGAGGGGGAATGDEVDGEGDDTGTPDDADTDGGEDDGAGADAEGEGGTDDGADDGEGTDLVVSLGDDGAANDDDAEAAIEESLGDDQLKKNAFARMRIEAKDLKRQTRDQAQRLRELEAQLATVKPAAGAVEVGKEPDPADYEMWEPEQAAKFKADLLGWTQRKAAAQQEQAQRQQAEQEQNQRWQSRLSDVDKASAVLKNAQAANEAFQDTFSPVQMGIILGGPDDAKTSAWLRYALGTNTAKAKELAKIQDPVKFAFAVAKLETQLKVTPRKSPPAPDTVVRSGGARGVVATENQLEKLREEARKTGDYSKVTAHKRAMAEKARKRA